MTHITIERAKLEQALEALEGNCTNPVADPEQAEIENKAIAAIKQALADHALDRMAENARELGLDYEPVQPVAWKHDCAALLQNDVELWIDRCPHCGKPRTTPPAQPSPAQCWKCGDMDAEFQAYCKAPACGMKENT